MHYKMKNLKYYFEKAEKEKFAIPQFNFSDFSQMKAIVEKCAEFKKLIDLYIQATSRDLPIFDYYFWEFASTPGYQIYTSCMGYHRFALRTAAHVTLANTLTHIWEPAISEADKLNATSPSQGPLKYAASFRLDIENKNVAVRPVAETIRALHEKLQVNIQKTDTQTSAMIWENIKGSTAKNSAIH